MAVDYKTLSWGRTEHFDTELDKLPKYVMSQRAFVAEKKKIFHPVP